MSIQNQTPEPIQSPENQPERHLHAVPDLPNERQPLHGPYTDTREAASMTLADIGDVPEVNHNPDLLRQAKNAKANSIGKAPVEFYYREKARLASTPGYRDI